MQRDTQGVVCLCSSHRLGGDEENRSLTITGWQLTALRGVLLGFVVNGTRMFCMSSMTNSASKMSNFAP